MKSLVKSFATLLSVMFACFAFADTPKSEPVSSEIRVANEIDKYDASMRALDRQFAQSFSELGDTYTSQRKSLRGKVTKKLNTEQKKLTQNGDLDRAIAVRSKIQSIKNAEIVVPNFADKNGKISQPNTNDGIQGTWRWNNGVDITNYDDGETSGRGTWQLVDAKQKIYQFNWSKIAPDRVRLSANGRVLEGTKAADPTFRVWAVRID